MVKWICLHFVLACLVSYGIPWDSIPEGPAEFIAAIILFSFLVRSPIVGRVWVQCSLHITLYKQDCFIWSGSSVIRCCASIGSCLIDRHVPQVKHRVRCYVKTVVILDSFPFHGWKRTTSCTAIYRGIFLSAHCHLAWNGNRWFDWWGCNC